MNKGMNMEKNYNAISIEGQGNGRDLVNIFPNAKAPAKALEPHSCVILCSLWRHSLWDFQLTNGFPTNPEHFFIVYTNTGMEIICKYLTLRVSHLNHLNHLIQVPCITGQRDTLGGQHCPLTFTYIRSQMPRIGYCCSRRIP